jgi:hypothetical protein
MMVDVAVARAVDHRLGQDRLASLLALENNPLQGVAGLDDIHAPGAEEHIDTGLLNHLVHQHLGRLGIDGRLIGRASPGGDGIGSHLLQPPQKLLADAAGHQLVAVALSDAGADHHQHDAVGPESAERTAAFDQRGLCAGARGGHGRGETRRPAAHNHDIGLMENGQFTRRLDHLAVLQIG